jgi:urease accessory protein
MRCAATWRYENVALSPPEIEMNAAAPESRPEPITELPLPPAHAETPPARLLFRLVNDRTVVGRSYATSPLRILTPRNHGHAAWAYTSTLGGGLVDGDRVRLDVGVGEGAAAVLATQGETRVYRSPRGCRSELFVEVEKDALLAVLPDPTVCFAGARYHQRTEIALAPGAALVCVDVFLSGRSARGERWAFERYASELTLRLGDRVILAEKVLLDPEHGPIAERFGRFEVFATVLIAGDRLRFYRDALCQKLDILPAPARERLVESANPLGEHALLVRMAAVSVEDVLRSIRTHLSFLPALLGDDPWMRRN